MKINIIVGGLIRLSRRFSRGISSHGFAQAWQRFRARLIARGYPASSFRVALARANRALYRFHTRQGRANPVRINAHSRAAPLGAALVKHSCCKVSRAVPVTAFVRNFKRTWKPEQVGRVGLDDKIFSGFLITRRFIPFR